MSKSQSLNEYFVSKIISHVGQLGPVRLHVTKRQFNKDCQTKKIKR